MFGIQGGQQRLQQHFASERKSQVGWGLNERRKEVSESDLTCKKLPHEKKEIYRAVTRGWGEHNKRMLIGRNLKCVYMLKGVTRGGMGAGRRRVGVGDTWGGTGLVSNRMEGLSPLLRKWGAALWSRLLINLRDKWPLWWIWRPNYLRGMIRDVEGRASAEVRILTGQKEDRKLHEEASLP